MNFQDILQQYNIQTAPEGHHHSTTGWVQVECPFCSKDSGHFRLGYNTAYGNLNCWVCGSHSILEYLVEVTGESYPRCKEMLGELDYRPKKTHTHSGSLRLPTGLVKLQSCHKKYLRKRGFDPNHIQEFWGVKGFTYHCRFAWRLFIPIHYRGRVVSFTTRSVVDRGVIRYISAKRTEEETPHKDLLYGEDWVRHGIIIVEGPVDVWRIGSGAVATFGMGYRQSQVLKMSKYPIRVICYDTDRAAQKKADRLAELLEPFPGKTMIAKLSSKDAGSATEEELLNLRRLIHD